MKSNVLMIPFVLWQRLKYNFHSQAAVKVTVAAPCSVRPYSVSIGYTCFLPCYSPACAGRGLIGSASDRDWAVLAISATNSSGNSDRTANSEERSNAQSWTEAQRCRNNNRQCIKKGGAHRRVRARLERALYTLKQIAYLVRATRKFVCCARCTVQWVVM